MFFERYDFRIRNRSSVYDEFERLATTRNWRQGSKRRKYEKAWRECFGDKIPVCRKFEDENGLARLLYDLEDLDLQERNGGERQERLRKVAQQFGTYYGMDDRALESWRALSLDYGVDGELASITKCKKVNTWVSRMTFADLDRH